MIFSLELHSRCETDDDASPKSLEFPIKTQRQTQRDWQRDEVVGDEIRGTADRLLTDTAKKAMGTA